MKPLRDLPIQQKVIAVILLASTGTLLLATISLVMVQWFRTHSTLLRDAETQAQIVAANSTAAVMFNDAPTANELLAALRAKPHLVHAFLQRPDGTLLAEYVAPSHRPLASAHNPNGHDADTLTVSEPIMVDGKRRATVQLEFDVGALRREIIIPFLAITATISAASLLLAILLSARLQRLISMPILKLSETAGRVAALNDYSVRAEAGSRDEIGTLTTAFNRMLERIQAADAALRQAHRELEGQVAERRRLTSELVEASRRAGMAEVATGVLHNVGNVLNSVNVSATLVQDELAGSKLKDLCRATDLLKQHENELGTYLTQDSRGQLLPRYFIALAEALKQEQSRWKQELHGLVHHIGHIKEIVSMQQSYARVAGVIERLSPRELVTDALRINQAGLGRRGIVVTTNFEPTADVALDRHKALQILVNLLANAQHAVEEHACDTRRIEVCVRPTLLDRVQITVTDNGVGIARENLSRIFMHGFTTKKNGHGFGLHMGALAAKELGGSLEVHSDGPGRGAKFTLELPCVTVPAPVEQVV